MQYKLFSNIVSVNAELERVKEVLVHPQYLLEWVPEITTVNQEGAKFIIKRAEAALNQHETITLSTAGNHIRYQSTGGKLAYQIVFTITETAAGVSVLQEELYIPEKTNLQLPLKLLAPIAKHTFNVNLNNLASLIEKLPRLEN
ncbi:SRPBCC family protein [Liquorilactobacillus satsumensis]|uniref:SRPBCC family protein n=1 Tax=Liquorilactobacillus satsumensis DSM 16230 = JCM 12392 TaxID=1423801 RepID=A0A0R1UUT5_9LACO|nr:SRPBCC family protein [Liquorilactobacillus satsumensis]KRL96814.1 hypothetical protein FD50_GL002095 [Liquorilactobacillus satsumensis DSM 16230 = JCM 12392]MCC7666445.1 SRPBCC family protein [Liquorilactobacillus satsumensis]MCP9312976.1 SRPBCC family protein [Liquorilactobacillus satsumensis]MCP9328922.1 SRPBCC family protein [Liquorilactobacillus satsumensis]MCP9356731.1 SRPBCC family protein [Liquorilactobacillus satsumensis]